MIVTTGESVIPIIQILVKPVLLYFVIVGWYAIPTLINRFINWLEIPCWGRDQLLNYRPWQIDKLITETIAISSW